MSISELLDARSSKKNQVVYKDGSRVFTMLIRRKLLKNIGVPEMLGEIVGDATVET